MSDIRNHQAFPSDTHYGMTFLQAAAIQALAAVLSNPEYKEMIMSEKIDYAVKAASELTERFKYS